jgi:hypothetical protein
MLIVFVNNFHPSNLLVCLGVPVFGRPYFKHCVSPVRVRIYNINPSTYFLNVLHGAAECRAWILLGLAEHRALCLGSGSESKTLGFRPSHLSPSGPSHFFPRRLTFMLYSDKGLLRGPCHWSVPSPLTGFANFCS